MTTPRRTPNCGVRPSCPAAIPPEPLSSAAARVHCSGGPPCCPPVPQIQGKYSDSCLKRQLRRACSVSTWLCCSTPPPLQLVLLAGCFVGDTDFTKPDVPPLEDATCDSNTKKYLINLLQRYERKLFLPNSNALSAPKPKTGKTHVRSATAGSVYRC